MYWNFKWGNFKFFYRRKSEDDLIPNGITWYHNMNDNTLFQIWIDLPTYRLRLRIRNPFIWGLAKNLIYGDIVNKIKDFKGTHWCETEEDKIVLLDFAKRHNIPQSDFKIEEGRF